MSSDAKNVLITGGAKGLGEHLARHLMRQGHRVFVLDRTESKSLSQDYCEALSDYATVDLADWVGVESCLARILDTAEGRIDVLVNNAAMRHFGDFATFDGSAIERCVRVNFTNPVLLTRKLLPLMLGNGYGRIINIGSRSGFRPYPSGSLYCSTKSALGVFTESVGFELEASGSNVTINAICPDSFSTREGARLSGFDRTLRTIASRVDSLLTQRTNGEVILVGSRRSLLADTALTARKRLRWLVK